MELQKISFDALMDPDAPFVDMLDIFEKNDLKTRLPLQSLMKGAPLAPCRLKIHLIPLGVSCDGPRKARNVIELLMQEHFSRTLKPFEMLSVNKAYPNLQMVYPIVSDTLALGVHPGVLALGGCDRGVYGQVIDTFQDFARHGVPGRIMIAATPTNEGIKVDTSDKKLEDLLESAWKRYSR